MYCLPVEDVFLFFLMRENETIRCDSPQSALGSGMLERAKVQPGEAIPARVNGVVLRFEITTTAEIRWDAAARSDPSPQCWFFSFAFSDQDLDAAGSFVEIGTRVISSIFHGSA